MARTLTPIGLLGCGSIGSTIAQALRRDATLNARLLAVYDWDGEKARHLTQTIAPKATVASTFDEFLGLPFRLLVESASQNAVREYGVRALSAGKNVVIMSVGALMDNDLREQLVATAAKVGRAIHTPSGAIGGLDLVRAAGEGKLYSVCLTTQKPPRAYHDAPYFTRQGISPGEIRSPRILYEGSAEEAVKLFPANVNVAAALSMAGLGGKATQVKIVADPNLNVNIHEIEIQGDFGSAKITVQNKPHPDNPGTSTLAALSAIETIRRACASPGTLLTKAVK